MKAFVSIVMALCLSTQAYANQCGKFMTKEWRTPEVVGAIELLAAAYLSMEIKKGKIARFSSFEENKALWNLNVYRPQVDSQMILNNPDYAAARMVALQYLDKNIGAFMLDRDHLELHLPAIAKFLGPVMLDRIEKLKWNHLREMRTFVLENIDAIIVNAIKFPKSGRIERLVAITKATGQQYIIPGVCLATGCVAAGVGIVLGGSALGEATDSTFIELVGLFGGSAAIWLGGLTGLGTTVMSGVLIPGGYISLSNSPGYQMGLYNHEIGRKVRANYIYTEQK